MPGERIIPASFIHPQQEIMWRKLKDRTTPEAAKLILLETIKEFQEVLTHPIERDPSDVIDARFFATFFDNDEGGFLAGRSHLVTMKFGKDDRSTDELGPVHAHIPVRLNALGLPGLEIYPDWRFLTVDTRGNSKTARFLLNVPFDLHGEEGMINIQAKNNGLLVVDRIRRIKVL